MSSCHRCAYVFQVEDGPDMLQILCADETEPRYQRVFCGDCWKALEPRIVKAIQNALVASFRDDPELPA